MKHKPELNLSSELDDKDLTSCQTNGKPNVVRSLSMSDEQIDEMIKRLNNKRSKFYDLFSNNNNSAILSL